MIKRITIFSSTSRSSRCLDYSKERESFVKDLKQKGKLKYDPYWDEGKGSKSLTTQLRDGVKFKKTVKALIKK